MASVTWPYGHRQKKTLVLTGQHFAKFDILLFLFLYDYPK